MVVYSEDGKRAEFNGMYFRKDAKTGYFLGTRKYQGRRKRLHVVVWEYFNGPVPAGVHVHHLDKDKNNNEIENLALMDSRQHSIYHGQTMTDD